MHIKHNNKIRKVKHIEVYAEPGEDNWFEPEDVEFLPEEETSPKHYHTRQEIEEAQTPDLQPIELFNLNTSDDHSFTPQELADKQNELITRVNEISKLIK